MSQVTIQINGRPYTVGCEDGQEAHLTQLASVFDKQVRQVATSVGPLAETRLFLLAALMMADELTDTRNRMTKVREQAEKLAADRSQTEMRSVRALEAVARRIEALSAKAEAKS
jgi:cell division protein ZapA